MGVSQSGGQIGDRDAERLGDDLDVPKGQIAFATLNAADVRPVETAAVRERLLRDPEPGPKLAHAPAESGDYVGSVTHGFRIAGCDDGSTDYESQGTRKGRRLCSAGKPPVYWELTGYAELPSSGRPPFHWLS